MLRKERVKECYELGLQVQDQNGRPISEHDKRKLKKQAAKMAERAISVGPYPNSIVKAGTRHGHLQGGC